MSEQIKWTAEQTAAINAKGRAVLVSAAAGSGKTAVLVEKLARMLTDTENPLPADKIVVVTFTKDAAAQMKSKLTNALTERLCAEDITEAAAEYISSQLALLPSANISTIHSYCFRLIRDNPGKTGADPAFGVVDPEDERDIILKAADGAFGELIKKSPETMKTLTDFFCGGERSIEKLTDIILELRQRYLTLPFPEEKMDSLVKYYKENSAVLSPGEGIAADYLRLASDRLKTAANAARCLGAYIANLKNHIPEDEMENPKLTANITAAAETVNDDHSLLKKLSDGLENELEEIFSGKKKTCTLFEEDPAPIQAGKPKTDKKTGAVTGWGRRSIPAIKFTDRGGAEQDAAAGIKEVRRLYYKAASDFYEFLNTGASAPGGTPMRFTESQIKSDFQKHGEILELLFGLLKDVMDRERDIKAERNVLGFCDAEQLACGLLCGREGDIIVPSETARAVSEDIGIVMIDEFQDSTEIQELIFRMLSRGGSAEAPGRNFFAVGDVKQSIYRFRSAEPELFMKSLRESVPYDEEGDSPSRILLRRNFRSSMPVVDFVNKFFTAVMSGRRGGVDYGEADSLVCGREVREEEFPVEIIEITDSAAEFIAEKRAALMTPKKVAEAEQNNGEEAANDGNEGAADKPGAEDYIGAEAAAVAKRIKRIISGTPGAKPSDFCILSRYSHYFPIYAKALEEAGLPSVSPAKTDLLDRGETLAVIDLLRAVDNPWKDVPLMSAMMSPLFMFTAEEMAEIRLFGEGGGDSLYGRIAAAAANEEADIRIRSRGEDFLKTFGSLRDYALTHTSQETILHIYEDMDYAAVTARSEGEVSGREKTENLDALVFAAARADSRGDGSVSAFVRMLETLMGSGGSMPVQSSGARDAVVIQTIHGSKGLEYPYVFLCGSSKSISGEEGAACFYHGAGTAVVGLDITVSAGDGSGRHSRERLRYKTLPSCTISEMKRRSERDEDMMLLYVALTRAAERLFITRLAGSASGKRSMAASILSMGAKCCGEKKRDCAALAEGCLGDIIASGLTEFELSPDISRYDPLSGTLRLTLPEFLSDISTGDMPYEPVDKVYDECACDNGGKLHSVNDGAELCDGEEPCGKGADIEIDPEIYAEAAALLSIETDVSLSLVPAKLTVTQLAKQAEGVCGTSDMTEKSAMQPVFGEAPTEEPENFTAENALPEFPEIDGYDPLEEETLLPIRGENSAADRGNAYHAFMEQADFARLFKAADKGAAIREEIAALADRGVLSGRQGELIDPGIIGKFIGGRLFSRVMKSGEFMRERKFLVKISDLGLDDEDLKVYTNTEGVLQGVADLIFKEGDGYVICDYKTDRTASPGLLVNRYRRQLRLYAAAFSLILGAPVREALIYSFSLGEEIRIKL